MPLRKNITFSAIDMDRMAKDSPQLSRANAEEVFHQLACGTYRPIPSVLYPMADIVEALELMRAGKHIGKVILTNYSRGPDASLSPLSVRARCLPRIFHPDATYLVTGGSWRLWLLLNPSRLQAGRKALCRDRDAGPAEGFAAIPRHPRVARL